MKKLLIAAAAVGAIAVAGCTNDTMTTAPESADPALAPPVGGGAVTFEVTIENMTPATGPGASQVFSPPVLATHHGDLAMFRVGRLASSELAQIAEDAVNQPMLDRLAGSRRVHDSLAGGGPIVPGGSATYTIEAGPGFTRLSAVWMLVNTNDAFSGLDSIQLPRSGEEVVWVGAYDAGSEENTELFEHIPGPCCMNPLQRVPTSEPIRQHPGISGRGDLDPLTYGWDGPVARVTIRRAD